MFRENKRLEKNIHQKIPLDKKIKPLDLVRERSLKKPMTAKDLRSGELEKKKSVDEYGKPVKKQIVLSNHYGKENAGLKGAGWPWSRSKKSYRSTYWQEQEASSSYETTENPKSYLTEREKSDYDDAPYSSDERTSAQKFAVYVYNRADNLIKQGCSSDSLPSKLQKKRIRYFLGKQEKSDYDAAPYEPEGRTEEQRKAVRFYHRIRDILEQYSNFNTIHQEVQDAREDIYGQNNLGSSSSYGYIPSHIFYNPSGYGSHYQPYNPYGYNSHYHEYYRGNDGFFEETYSATPIHGKSPYRANVSYGCAVSVTQMLLRDQKMVVVQSRRIALSRL